MTRIRYRQLAIVTTIGVCFLTVAGGAVRLTGSGLGCDDWPNCNNERFIDVSTGHAAIEQLNRLLSGFIAVPTLLLVIAAFRAAPRGAGLRWPALGVLLTVLANGVVGGMAVLGDLHPALVQSHFLLAMVSIAFGLIAVRAASERRIAWRNWSMSNSFHLLLLGVVVLTAAALLTGTIVTGAGPHAGDEDARRFGLDIGSVARNHSATVILAVACGALLAMTVARRVRPLQGAMSSWLFIAIVQGGIGYAQYFTGVPEILVGLHIAGATLLWVATVRLGLSGLDASAGSEPAERHTAETERLFGSTTTTV